MTVLAPPAPAPSNGVRWRQLHPPRPLTSAAVLHFIRQLAADGHRPAVTLELHAVDGQITYWLATAGRHQGRLARQLRDLLPGSTLIDATPDRPLVDRAVQVRLSTRHRPLDTADPVRIVRALLSALTMATSHERLVLQLVLGPGTRSMIIPANLHQSAVQPLWATALRGTGGRIDIYARQALRDKKETPGIRLVIRIGVVAVGASRQKALLLGVLAALRTAEAPGVSLNLVPDSATRLQRAHIPWRWPLGLNAHEIVPLTGLPITDHPADSLPGQAPAHPKQLAPTRTADALDRIVAEATAPGVNGQLGYSPADATRHTAVLGPNGTGKSTLLLSLICQDMAAGRAVIVIEPKDLVSDVLARIPKHRRTDVVLLDALDESPVGVNPLQAHGRSPEVVADHLLGVFRSLYGDGLGPRSSDILQNALNVLARRPDASLVMLPLLLTNPGFRRSLTQRAMRDDPVAGGPFWKWFEALSDEARATITAPLQNKLRPLLRPDLRGVLAQLTPRFNVRQILSEQKILLVPLQKGVLGPEAAELLAAVVLGEVWQAIRERAAVPESQRHPAMIYVDEVQEFLRLPTDLSDALATSRSLGAAFHLAHQFLGQLSPAMRAAFEANARSRIAFQLSATDARAMAAGQVALEPEDFSALPVHHIYASLVQQGAVTPWASGRTLPPSPPISDPDKIRALSRSAYGQPLSQIEAGFAALLDGESDVDPDDPKRPTGGRRPRRTS